MRRAAPILLALLLSAFPGPVWGGSFRVLPTLVDLDPRSKTAVVRLINEGDEKLTLQLKGAVWSQDERGQDQYVPTDTLIFFPRIVTLNKGEERVVRLAYQGPAAPQELTFRLFVEELPVLKPGVSGLVMILRVGIPVFVKPAEEVKDWSLAGVTVAEGFAHVLVRNGGNSHLMVASVAVKAADGAQQPLFRQEAKGWYVLSGKTVPFRVPLPPESCPNVRQLTAEAAVDKDTKTLAQSVQLQPDQCTPKPEPARPAAGPQPEPDKAVSAPMPEPSKAAGVPQPEPEKSASVPKTEPDKAASVPKPAQ